MAERSRGRSRSRSLLARHFIGLGRVKGTHRVELSYLQIILLLATSLVITLLMIEVEFQSLPDYGVGEIAERTIEAPRDFTIVDEEATEEKRDEAIQTVPFVFNYEFAVTTQQISELRSAFSTARDLIAEARETFQVERDVPFSTKQLRDVRATLAEALPRFAEGNVLDICLHHFFAKDLEDQLAQLLMVAMQYPGVVPSRDPLIHLQDRGITIHDVVKGQDRSLSDWTALKDVQQARDVISQREFQLTVVNGEEKRKLLGFLESWVVQNTIFDATKTQENEEFARLEVDPVLLQIKKGKTIVRRGDSITVRELAQLNELKKVKRQEQWLGRSVGVFLIVCFYVMVFWLYFQLHQQESRSKKADFLLIVVVTLVSLIITRAFVALAKLVAGSLSVDALWDPLNFYFFTPFALGAILTILLLGTNASIFFSLVFTVLVGLFTGEISLMLYVLTGSIAAVYALRQYRERSAIVRAGLIIGAVNVMVAFAIQLYAAQGDFAWVRFMVRTGGGFVSGLTAAMLASLFLPFLETLFGLTTDIRLLELSNLNSPLLRRLALEAPGTYHHSITVGTLAEAGAEEIGANGLLTRVGAYYHDIGKLKHPDYYIENQVFTGNKHESLAPSMSTLILTSHVKDGLAMAEEVGLGPKVRDLIPQHHGTRIMSYFFQKAKEAEDGKVEVNESDYRYPGPKPQFREAAILMLADQVEAAARTLQEPSPGQIRSLIRRITQSTIRDGQFDECDVTLKELSRVGDAFERVLTGMYHHRIDYPGFDFNRHIEERTTERQPVQ